MVLKSEHIAKSTDGRDPILFVSDFHGTFSNEGIREDYLRVLIHLHTDGHHVAIISGEPMDAQSEVNGNAMIEEVLASLDQPPEMIQNIRDTLLTVIDRLDYVSALRDRGVPVEKIAKPDVVCDDHEPLRKGEVYLHPDSEEFEGFLAAASFDLKGALDELLVDNDDLKLVKDSDNESQAVYEALVAFQAEYPEDFNSFYLFAIGYSQVMFTSDEGAKAAFEAGLISSIGEREIQVNSIAAGLVRELYSAGDAELRARPTAFD